MKSNEKTALILFALILITSITWVYLFLKKPAVDVVYYQNKVLVLTYHHIDEKTNAVTIPPKLFEEHMKILMDYRYNVISMEEFIQFLEGSGDVPPNAVVIAFDDGYESFYTVAYPILKQYHYVATNFIVVSSTVLQNTPIPHLTWEQMKTMKKDGMSFYSHTYDSHKMLPINKEGDEDKTLISLLYLPETGQRETQEQYERRIREDLQNAETLLQKNLGNQKKLLAFPYGVFNPTVINIARELGIHYTLTVKEGINKPGTTEIYRLNAGDPNISPYSLLKELKTYKDQN